MSYECDRCGACCKYSIIEIDQIDIAREPRFLSLQPLRMPENFVINFTEEEAEEYLRIGPLVPGFENGAMLAPSSRDDMACPMLGSDNLCTVYPTRPNCCVAMQAGSDQCQMFRQSAGLAQLEPMKEGDKS